MLRIEPLTQPAHGRISDHLCRAIADTRYRTLEAAVAYVTSSGVAVLSEQCGANLNRISARWLTSFDWCRSDPVGLAALGQFASSEVRVFDGQSVVGRRGCVPVRSFHPKGFVLTGPQSRLVILGSGNLSRNGLRKGTELDAIIEVTNPKTLAERNAWAMIESIRTWHSNLWSSADPYATLAAKYADAYKRSIQSPVPTDDDCSDPSTRLTSGSYSPEQLIKMGRASLFWIEAGNLTENLGRGNPGSQLMMRALTRVFFGFDSNRVHRQTPIGTVAIQYGGNTVENLSIEFAHNSMDRLNLPRPGTSGPAKYDSEILVFRKTPDKGRVIYGLSISSETELKLLQKNSTAADMSFRMPAGGRQFGFCFS